MHDDLVRIIDQLVINRDHDTLEHLYDFCVGLILSNIAVDGISFIDVAEFVGQIAIGDIQDGVPTEKVLQHPLRKLLDEH